MVCLQKHTYSIKSSVRKRPLLLSLYFILTIQVLCITAVSKPPMDMFYLALVDTKSSVPGYLYGIMVIVQNIVGCTVLKWKFAGGWISSFSHFFILFAPQRFRLIGLCCATLKCGWAQSVSRHRACWVDVWLTDFLLLFGNDWNADASVRKLCEFVCFLWMLNLLKSEEMWEIIINNILLHCNILLLAHVVHYCHVTCFSQLNPFYRVLCLSPTLLFSIICVCVPYCWSTF